MFSLFSQVAFDDDDFPENDIYDVFIEDQGEKRKFIHDLCCCLSIKHCFLSMV